VAGRFEREIEPGADYGLSRLWLVFRANVVLILAIVAVTAVAAAVVTMLQPVTYESTVTLVVSEREKGDIETLTRTLGALLRSETIGEDLRSSGIELSPRDIANRISVERPPGSGVLEIRVTDTSAQRSQRIAAAIPTAFVNRVSQQLEAPEAGRATTSAPAVRAWDTSPDTERVPRPLARNGAVASLLGLILAAFAVAVRERMSPGVGSAAEAEASLGLPVLGSLPPLDGRRRGMAAPLDGVRAILAAAERDGWKQTPRSILVAGPASPSERALFSLLLALALSESGKRVLLVDADFETRALSSRLGLIGVPGLTKILRGDANIDDVEIRLEGTGAFATLKGLAAKKGSLTVVPAGFSVSDRSALMSTDVAAKLHSQRRDAILVISGPSLVGSNPVWGLASGVQAVLAVIGEGSNVWSARATADLLQARSPKVSAVLLSSRRMEVRASSPAANGSAARTRATGEHPAPREASADGRSARSKS
jgi:capsular polysaccharide biosynthesis protein/MinD-like ATPase involved in chromosome partitioning or flagellar assembly